jgi:hypothetical protein
MVVGEKRYLLLPPAACSDLSLLPYGHPSARHSNITLAQLAAYAAAEESRKPPVANLPTKSWTRPEPASDAPHAHAGNAHLERYLGAQALDVLLSPGDVLHLPAYVLDDYREVMISSGH